MYYYHDLLSLDIDSTQPRDAAAGPLENSIRMFAGRNHPAGAKERSKRNSNVFSGQEPDTSFRMARDSKPTYNTVIITLVFGQCILGAWDSSIGK